MLAGVVSRRLSSVFIAILMILVGIRFVLSARSRRKASAEEPPSEVGPPDPSTDRSSAQKGEASQPDEKHPPDANAGGAGEPPP